MRTGFLILSTVAVILSADQSNADCPTQQSMRDYGAYVMYDDKSVSRYYQTSSGNVVEVNFPGNGPDFLYEYEQGILLTKKFTMYNGLPGPNSIVTYQYSGGKENLGSIQPGGELLQQAIEKSANGSSHGTVLISKGLSEELLIGGETIEGIEVPRCSY